MQTWDYQDKATYWGAPVTDGWGTKTYDAPIILDVRWENRAEKFITMSGEDSVSRAVVWLKQTIDLGGYLFRGESALLDPTKVDTAYEIRMLFEIPSLRQDFIERRAFL